MQYSNVYVIVDGNGNYISPRNSDTGWYFVTYSGVDSGFTFYTKESTARSRMENIARMGCGFDVKCVNYKDIKEGKIVT